MPHCAARLATLQGTAGPLCIANSAGAIRLSGITYRGVHGPADLSLAQVAETIGTAVGRKVLFVPTTPNQAHETFLQMSASPDFARLYVEMFAALAKSEPPAEPRTPETTTPTTLHDWAIHSLNPALVG